MHSKAIEAGALAIFREQLLLDDDECRRAAQAAVQAYLAAMEAEGFEGQLVSQLGGGIEAMAKGLADFNEQPEDWRAYEDEALFAQEAYHLWLAANGFVVLAARPQPKD